MTWGKEVWKSLFQRNQSSGYRKLGKGSSLGNEMGISAWACTVQRWWIQSMATLAMRQPDVACIRGRWQSKGWGIPFTLSLSVVCHRCELLLSHALLQCFHKPKRMGLLFTRSNKTESSTLLGLWKPCSRARWVVFFFTACHSRGSSDGLEASWIASPVAPFLD